MITTRKSLLLLIALGFGSCLSVFAQNVDVMSRADSDVYMFHVLPKTNITMRRQWSPLPVKTIVQQYVPQDTVTIYGVALTIVNQKGALDSVDAYGSGQHPSDYKAVLMEKDATGSSPAGYIPFREIDTVSIYQDTNRKFCKMAYETADSIRLTPCYEFYFDTPRVVMDTFYVGRSWSVNGDPDVFFPSEYAALYSDSFPSYFYYGLNGVDFETFTSYVTSRRLWGFAFPIIGFRCKPLDEEDHSLLLSNIGYDIATVNWYSVEEGATYNVHLYSTAGDVDTVVTTTDSSYTFSGLPRDRCYRVQVRKQCYYATAAYDTIVYSPWTMTNTSFILGDTSSHSGTDTTGGGGDTTIVDTTVTAIGMVAGADFVVVPNPVHGTAEVSLPQPLDSDGVLSLYDLDGREVYQQMARGGEQTIRFHTRGFRAGVYILKLTTANGCVVKRIVVL